MVGNFLAASGPPELLLHILQYSESTRDVLSFALTCRFMSEVWHANGAGHAVMWHLLLHEIPHAKQALVAVRANEAVVKAAMKGELPPKAMKLPRLSDGELAQPNASELNAVWKTHHFVDAVTLHIGDGDFIYPPDLEGVIGERSDGMEEWRDGVHRAIYRALITTAALMGPYCEPLFEAKRSQNEELRALVNKRMEYCFPTEVVRFAQSFPLYKMRPTPNEEHQTFGFLAEWLKENILADTKPREAMEDRFDKTYGRAIECKLRGDCPLKFAHGDGSHSDSHLIALEIMRVLWMCENLAEIFTLNTLSEFAKANLRLRHIGPIPVFGDFSLRVVEFTGAHGDYAALNEFSSTWFHSGQYNNYEWGISKLLEGSGPDLEDPAGFEEGGVLATPLRLRFFGYCLREYVGAVFSHNFFFKNLRPGFKIDLRTFLQCATLFSLDEGEFREHYPGDSSIYDVGYLDDAGFLDGSEVLISSDSRLTLQ